MLTFLTVGKKYGTSRMEISDVFKSQHHQKLDGPLDGRNKECNNNIGNWAHKQHFLNLLNCHIGGNIFCSDNN